MATVDHSQFQFAAERYVLGELSGSELLAFEDHFFNCAACAHDVEDLLAIRDAVPSLLPQLSNEAAGASDTRRGRWSWLPGLAWAALALLAVFTGYQNSVVIPHLKATPDELRLVQSTDPIGAKRGPDQVILSTGQRLVTVPIEAEWTDKYDSYDASITNLDTHKVLTTELQAQNSDKPLSLVIPTATLGPGKFELIISGKSKSLPARVVVQQPLTIQGSNTR